MVRLTTFAVALLLLFAACGDDDGGESSSFCEERDNLQASVSQLQDVDVVETGTDGVQTAIEKVKQDASALADEAGDEFSDEADAIRSSVDELETAVKSFDSGNPGQGLEAVSTSISGVVASLQALGDATADACS